MNMPHRDSRKTPTIIIGVVILAAIGYGAYYAYGLYQKLQDTEKELASRTVGFESNIRQLKQNIAEVMQENEDIKATLTDEQIKNLDLEAAKRRNERKIDTLTKLTTIDPELLKKYSKVYFLSENYVPPALTDIDTKYLIDPVKPLQILDEVATHLEDMLRSASRDEVQVRIVSAYRSFAEQKDLKSGYRVQYGTGANTFSAEQGYSEHQMGTTVDLTTPVLKGAYPSFDTTTAYAWLTGNAYKYGFVLSYPKGNSYYVYEPWHWRFVGEDLADHLHDEGLNFYEMDQRDIDEYLINIFD